MEALRRDSVSELNELRARTGSAGCFHVHGAITNSASQSAIRDWCELTPLPAQSKWRLQNFGRTPENGHKVLVFSQFVRHLELIRPILGRTRSGIPLFGRLNADQGTAAAVGVSKWEHDVFLISLRAGGLGLNLTAANYVIHLDPGGIPPWRTVPRPCASARPNQARDHLSTGQPKYH